MSGRSNFTSVRTTDGGTKLELTGESTNPLEVKRICLAYGKAPSIGALVAENQDLLPREKQTEKTVQGPFGETWTITIPLTNEFTQGGAIVIAASALRVGPKPEAAEAETWLGYIQTGLGPDEGKDVKPIVIDQGLAGGNP